MRKRIRTSKIGAKVRKEKKNRKEREGSRCGAGLEEGGVA